MAIGNLFGGFISDIAGGLYEELPEEVTKAFGPVPTATAPDVTFQPFTVTSGLGTTTAGPSGTQYQLSPQQQAIQNALMREAQYRIGGSPIGALESMFAGADVMDLGQQMMGQTPFGLTQQQQAAQQAFGLGGQFMGAAGQRPEDVEALRQQYGALASQSAMDVLSPTAAREASVFERIRATQRPEEERQRLALEERMAQQGRLGVRTAMFGGTPEQFALAQAQEEAQNRASLAAIQQAQAERQQALGTAQALGGMFGQQAGLSSQLQSAAQQRAAQLSQLGLSAQQIESQLQSEGLGRAATSAQQAAQLAQVAGGLQAQQAGLGAQYAGLGSQLAMQDIAAQQAQQQLALGALTGSYIPQTQLLAAQQAAQLYPQLQQRGQLFGAGQFGETSMAGLEARLVAEQAAANLLGGIGSGLLGGLFSPIATSGGGVGSLFGSVLSDLFD